MSLQLHFVELARVAGSAAAKGKINGPLQHIRYASRLARRVAARGETLKSQPIPPNAPKTASSWERAPAVPPQKGYWKSALLIAWLGGPAVRMFTLWLIAQN